MVKVLSTGSALFQQMGKDVRAWCERKGWRVSGGGGYPDPLGRTFGDEIALMHSELSEALEAYREWRMDPMLKFETGDGYAVLPPGDPNSIAWVRAGSVAKPEGVASELADLLIRLLDTCEYAGIDLFEEYRKKMDYNETRAWRHGGKGL